MNRVLLDVAETAAKTLISLIPGLGAAGPILDEGINLADELFGLGQSALKAAQDGLSQDEVDSMVGTMDDLVTRVDAVLKGGVG